MGFFHIPPSGNPVSIRQLGRFLKSNSKTPIPDFRKTFAAYSGFSREDIHYTGSGTAAFYLALLALKRLHPGKVEVILPGWLCPSVPQAILQAGLRPVQVDLDPETFAYPPAELAAAVSDKTLTVLLVHFFGIAPPKPELPNPPPMYLRDCAQDFQFRNAGETDCAIFYSFGRGKALNAGHGGALCLPKGSPLQPICREILETFPAPSIPALPKAVLINALSHPWIYGGISSLPFLSIGKTVWPGPLRFTRIHPSFFGWGKIWFEGFERQCESYAKLVNAYMEAFSGIPGIFLPGTSYTQESVPVRFPLLVAKADLRERLIKSLNQKFGGVTRQYPEILSHLPGTPAEFPSGGSYPGCERIAREILTFPVTAWLSGREREFLREARRLLL